MIKNKSKLRTFLRMISSNRKLKYRWFGSRKKSLRKHPPPPPSHTQKKQQQPKPNPISNLTLTLSLIPHRGLFPGGVFPETRWFTFLLKIYFQKMSWHIAAYYINLVKAILRHQKLRQNMQESLTVTLSHHVKYRFINIRSIFCR